MKINIGDYVRTRDGNIAKYIGYDGFYNFDNYVLDEAAGVNDELLNEILIKSSPNIIDLLEEGDFLNGWRVEELEKDTDKTGTIIRVANLTFNVLPDEEIWLPKHTDYDYYQLEKLKSIVTKEQFESMEYKIGE